MIETVSNAAKLAFGEFVRLESAGGLLLVGSVLSAVLDWLVPRFSLPREVRV